LIKRVGAAVILLPKKGGWETLVNSLGEFSPDFFPQRDQPPQQKRASPFK
jgi:virulence-associated protein VagC